MSHAPPSFFERLVVALGCFRRVLGDPGFASRIAALSRGSEPPPALPSGLDSGRSREAVRAEPEHGQDAEALNLLALFQREGRLVDFLEQEIESFPDAAIGAAARVVHAGCRKALHAHFDLERVRTEPEGSPLTLHADDVSVVTLTGNVQGAPPYRGTLRHAGWRVLRVCLPKLVPGHDAALVCPAEVEL